MISLGAYQDLVPNGSQPGRRALTVLVLGGLLLVVDHWQQGSPSTTDAGKATGRREVQIAGVFGKRGRGSHGTVGRTPQACAECHQSIARQWSCSAHARAWVHEDFVKDSFNHTGIDCLPCHAPTPLLHQPNRTAPATRSYNRESGIDCHACHACGDAYAGPYKTFGPHRTRQTGRLSRGSFCGSCHAAEYEEYTTLYIPSAKPRGGVRQCVACHMPAMRTRLTQGKLLSLIHPKRIVRDHSLKVWTPRLLRHVIEVGAPRVRHLGDDRVEFAFTLTNRRAGHRIPTGDWGHRELLVWIELRAEDGTVVGQAHRSLLADRHEGLAPGAPTLFTLTPSASGTAKPVVASLRVERVNADRSFRIVLATGDWSLDGRADSTPSAAL